MIENLFGSLLILCTSPAYESKEPYLRNILTEYKMDPKETVYIDDRLDQLRSALTIKDMIVVRMQPEFYTPLLPDLVGLVSVVKSMKEFEEFICRGGFKTRSYI